jgi:hypothetical protein
MRVLISLTAPSQIDWGTLDLSDNRKTLTRKKIVALEGPDLVRWMTKAVLKSIGSPVGLGTLEAQPMIYPFGLGENLGFVLSSAPDIDLRADSTGNQIVSLITDHRIVEAAIIAIAVHRHTKWGI